ncbi:MAG: helix-turn-helix domain-containing protein [Moraxella equi]|nr:helix-turn-helix domain-containing protein [Moraxella equi]
MSRTPKLATQTPTFGVLFMAKYTTDFKLSVIEYYLNHHSYHQTAKHFNLDHKTVELWVKLYQVQWH